MNFSKKLEELSGAGFDVTGLKKVGVFRNTISHGLIFGEENAFTIKLAAKPKTSHIELSIITISENIEILKLEGGKLLDFTEAMGYTYHAPKTVEMLKN